MLQDVFITEFTFLKASLVAPSVAGDFRNLIRRGNYHQHIEGKATGSYISFAAKVTGQLVHLFFSRTWF